MPPKNKGAKPHGNQRGPALRVRLNGGPFIDPITMGYLTEWNEMGVSFGALIDRLVTHAILTRFDPRKDKAPKVLRTPGA
jgi:hypothetical protein